MKDTKLNKASDNSRDVIVAIEGHTTKMGFIIAKVQGKVDDAMFVMEELHRKWRSIGRN